jgi:hypothetical protein
MKRLTYLLPALLLCACLEDTLDEELGDMPRGSSVSICIHEGECRIDLLGQGCTPVEHDACETGGHRPAACTDVFGQCLVPVPGDECPQAWFEVCEFYSGI